MNIGSIIYQIIPQSVSGKVSQGRPNPRTDNDVIEIRSSEQRIIQDVTEKTKYSKELFAQYLKNIVNFGTNKNPELKQKRLDYLSKKGIENIEFIENCILVGFDDIEKSAFLFDHADEITAIIRDKKIPKFSILELLRGINSKNFSKIQDVANSIDSNNDNAFAVILYSCNDHKIEFGNEEVTVPTAEIICLLTGINSPSTSRNKNYDEFNQVVRKLIVDSYETNNLQYNQIAEGILTQEPKIVEYAEIFKNYCKYMRDNGETNILEKIEQFFTENNPWSIPEKLTLKTIVPDENALMTPSDTLDVFKYKLSKQKV